MIPPPEPVRARTAAHSSLAHGPCHVVAICSGSTLLGEDKARFEAAGIRLTEVCSEAEALLRIGGGDVQAVLIDSRLKAIPAPEMVAAIHRYCDLPILVALEGSDSGHRVGYESLTEGAGGLLTLPVGTDALARMLATAGYRPSRNQAAIRRGGLELDPRAMVLSFPGGRIDLNLREISVVRVLLTAAPDTVSLGELEKLWENGSAQPSRNARMAVLRIRQKLSAAVPGGELMLQTVRGRGYRLIG
ncbi:winged helix-turn-helix domain-containing protein [Paeniglutamicibacter sulfureus]|uniref:winged helix-turn-helix domain-containing protein n=1 Tax=Paeniglutamicibacter sulfureus TaxID=43666 RepID=UPI0026663214|nr:winged helix-turn-helix domain-containing protein [Paeniglutamicibacter sulfureus]MDO2934127.1 winged helix-turn-helix domain-containing protein [Paeniglutamicibacter sulfureus]